MTKKSFIQPVILCGGSGTRLWPLSRTGFPKQFLCLSGKESLFQQTALRLATIDTKQHDVAKPLIVGNDEHRFLILDQLREISDSPAAILLEPVGRNTAPAMTFAALTAIEKNPDSLLVVSPADQMISDAKAFTDTLTQAIDYAKKDALVILGIKPNRPETGYGYIQTSNAESNDFKVLRFVEKPDLPTAEAYLAAGDFYWNGGIFVVKASVWLAAIQKFRNDIYEATLKAWNGRKEDALFIRPDKDAFEKIPSESIDYAVIEQLPTSDIPIYMIPLNAGWSDLGSWDAVWQAATKDASGNAQFGDAIIKNGKNVLVHASHRLVSVIGLEDIVVVETADAVLVTSRKDSQNVKNIVADLSARSSTEHEQHRKVHRPWGWYDSIDEGTRFKVKHIMVNPGASLSLQKHQHRAEHWVVVCGNALITCGNKEVSLGENESTFIPQGEIHRLSNPGTIPLEIIEVQSGSYLGEDDIIRLEDNYGRHQ